MEHLNKIELKGCVGRATTQSGEHASLVNFSVATNYAYKDKDGNAVIETQWFDCRKTYRTSEPMLELHRGDNVHVIGRLQTRKYIGADGEERTMVSVICQKVEKI